MIREKRKLVISKRVITPDKIRQLASVINREATEPGNDNNHFVIFSVDATDNSSYESQSSVIFERDQLIEKKIIHKVTMRYSTFSYDKNIEIQLKQTHEKDDKENFILVSGDDPTWVNGIIAELSEIIELSKKQWQNKTLIGWSVVFLTVASIFFYVRLVATPLIVLFDNEWLRVFLYFGIPFLGLMAAAKLDEYLKFLWPAIELETGPEYMDITRKKRKKVEQIVLLFIVPLVLAAVYDFVKSVVLNQ